MHEEREPQHTSLLCIHHITKPILKSAIYPAFAFLLGLTCGLLLLNQQPLSSLGAITFTLLGVLGIAYAFRRANEHSNALAPTLACAAIHAGLIVAGFVMKAGPTDFWVQDSYVQHLPRAKNIAGAILGTQELRGMHVIWDKIYLGQVAVGLGFSILGEHPWVSAIALSILKTLSIPLIFLLGRQLESNRVGFIAALVFALNPMTTFHSIVFYKEAGVYLICSLVFYLAAGGPKNQTVRLFLSVLASAILFNERFYIGLCLLLGLGSNAIFSRNLPPKKRAAFLTAASIGVFSFFFFYRNQVDPLTLWQRIYEQRVAYLSYSDVSEINRLIPWPISALKLYFSPYFTVDKVLTYPSFAQLIPWGSVLHHTIMLLAAIGVLSRISKRKSSDITITVGFIVFICLFGFVAPYASRLRDTFMPVIVVYAVIGFDKAISVLGTYRAHRSNNSNATA